jgi:hypothetical protein
MVAVEARWKPGDGMVRLAALWVGIAPQGGGVQAVSWRGDGQGWGCRNSAGRMSHETSPSKVGLIPSKRYTFCGGGVRV